MNASSPQGRLRYLRRSKGVRGPAVALAALLALASSPSSAANLDEVVRLDQPDAGGFGFSVAVSGRFVAVGAPWDDDATGNPGDWSCDSGSVFLYERDFGGADSWGLRAELHAPSAVCGDEFGSAVALSGSYLVVGAPWRSNTGTALIFARAANGSWVLEREILGSAVSFNDRFGAAVAIAGTTVAIAAPSYIPDGTVLVHERNQGGVGMWGQVKQLLPPAPNAAGRFGAAVALQRDRVLIGDPWSDEAGPSQSGSASIFRRDLGGASAWGHEQTVVAPDAGSGEYFGSSVAIFDGGVLVGATHTFYSGEGDSGAAYYFTRPASVWLLEAKLRSSSPNFLGRFGSAVSGHNQLLLVGASGDDYFETSEGALYGYQTSNPEVATTGPPLEWTESRVVAGTGSSAFYSIGGSLAADGCVAVVGAIRGASTANDNAGTAYIKQSGIFCDDFELGTAGRW